MLRNSGLQVTNLVDLQKQYRVEGSTKKVGEKDSLEELAVSIICPSYKGKKTGMDTDTRRWLHSAWEGELTLPHIIYTALDAFVSYDLYRRISTMRECLVLEEILDDPAEDPVASSEKKKTCRRGGRSSRRRCARANEERSEE